MKRYATFIVVLCAVLTAPAAASAAPKPDLVVSAVGDPPANVVPGGTLTIRDSVRNKGTKKAKASVNEYTLSTDSKPNAADLVLGGARSVKALKADGKSTGETVLSVPPSAKPGTVRVIVCADAGKKLKEEKERNNCDASSELTVGGAPPGPPPDATPPAKPEIVDTDPNSPSADISPEVQGAGAEDGSTVKVFANATCAGSPIGSGPAAAFNDGAGITATVPVDTTTSLAATATDAANNTSACSTPYPYIHGIHTESEPNGAAGSADAIPGGDASILGSIDPAADQDWFSFTVPAGPDKALVAETFDASGASCALIDTAIAVFAPNGTTQIVQDDDDGADGCSLIDGTGLDFGTAGNFPPGTYYVQVTGIGAEIDAYRLKVGLADPVTGSIESEPNDVPGEADPMPAAEEPILAAINPGTDEDWFSFTVPAGPNRAVIAETFDGGGTGCAGLDLRMGLYAPDGTTVLAEDDDDGPGNCAKIDGTGLDFGGAGNLTPGTYFVRVVDNGQNTVVPGYKLEVNVVAPPTDVESEPNDGFATADPMPAAEASILASITSATDEDWFSFTVPAGPNRAVIAETFDGGGTNCTGGVDTELELYAGDGTTVLAQDSDDGTASCSRIDGSFSDAGAASLAPGTYFVRVTDDAQDTVIGAYRLRVNLVAAPSFESEPNDGFATADPMPAAEAPILGSINPVADEDWFALTVTGGNRAVDASISGPGGVCAGIDAVVELYGTDGTTMLATDRASGFANCPRIAGSASHHEAAGNLAPGTYFLRVIEFAEDGTIGAYQLTANLSAPTPSLQPGDVEPNGTPATASPLSDPALIGGSIDPIGDLDWYSISVPAGADLRIETFTGPGACAATDSDVYLFAPDGTTQLARDDDDGIGTCSRIDGTTTADPGASNLSAGTYFLRVEKFQNNAVIPAYRLSLRVLP